MGAKSKWVELVNEILWAYQTTQKTFIGKLIFSSPMELRQ
jgi:hypothetical protein